jgi:hypothetical protein
VNGTTLETPDVRAYLDAVRAELADLPAEEREDLLADVEASLVDSGDPPQLAPAAFAAELREAAGLEPTSPAMPPGASLLDSLRAWTSSDRAAALRSTARELEPIWWLVRGYVAAAAVALLAGWGWPLGTGTRSYTLSIETSALVLVLAVVVSVWLGLRSRRGAIGLPRVRRALNLALAVATLPVAVHSLNEFNDRAYADVVVETETVPGLALDGRQLTNLYPYSRDGRLLHDVLLYDDRGLPVPIMIGFDDPLRRVLERADGRQIRNSYPIRYYEPGTRQVARPNLAPRVSLPEIVTPPLERDPR